MAVVGPFRGIRYSESAVGEIGKVVSPPYDVISPQDRVYYHQLHPNNFVRLVLGEEFGADDEADNRFTRAKGYLDAWLASGILAQDTLPAIYLCEQQFDQDGRRKRVRGITAAVKIQDYADRVIVPHENTLAKPKSQLIQLIRQTQANLDSIYGLYADAHGALAGVMDKAMTNPALARARDKNGVDHALWRLSGPDEIGLVTDFFADKQIAIADGHHRYETAMNYRDEMREERGSAGGELASDYTLMTLVNVYEPDITVYPTHRVVADLPGELVERLDESLRRCFEIGESSKERLPADMAARGAIGMYRRGDARTLKVKGKPDFACALSEAGRKLELNVLHELILRRVLGIDEDKMRNQTHIVYTRDAQEAMELVDSGEKQVAFLLNHIDVKSVLEVAAAGERMPQKATYFYPKLISGLVLRKM